jgi:ADP-ribose diphosphatase
MEDEHGVGFVHCDDGVLVVPVTAEMDVLLAVERSSAFDREILTLVSGTVEHDEPLADTANRELQEELGWRAERIDFVGELHPFKYLATRQFLFLARDLARSELTGDEQHPIGLRRVPLDRWPQLCAAGELRDSLAVAGLFMVQSYLALSSPDQSL